MWGTLSTETMDLPIKKHLDVTKLADARIVWLSTRYGPLRFEVISNQLLLKPDSYTNEVRQVDALYVQECARRARVDPPSLKWFASIQNKRRTWERTSKLWLGSTLIVRATGYDSAIVQFGQITSIQEVQP